MPFSHRSVRPEPAWRYPRHRRSIRLLSVSLRSRLDSLYRVRADGPARTTGSILTSFFVSQRAIPSYHLPNSGWLWKIGPSTQMRPQRTLPRRLGTSKISTGLGGPMWSPGGLISGGEEGKARAPRWLDTPPSRARRNGVAVRPCEAFDARVSAAHFRAVNTSHFAFGLRLGLIIQSG